MRKKQKGMKRRKKQKPAKRRKINKAGKASDCKCPKPFLRSRKLLLRCRNALQLLQHFLFSCVAFRARRGNLLFHVHFNGIQPLKKNSKASGQTKLATQTKHTLYLVFV